MSDSRRALWPFAPRSALATVAAVSLGLLLMAAIVRRHGRLPVGALGNRYADGIFALMPAAGALTLLDHHY